MSKRDTLDPLASFYDGYFRFHSADGLRIEEELAEIEGRRDRMVLKPTWNRDKSLRAGADDLTTKEDD